MTETHIEWILRVNFPRNVSITKYAIMSVSKLEREALLCSLTYTASISQPLILSLLYNHLEYGIPSFIIFLTMVTVFFGWSFSDVIACLQIVHCVVDRVEPRLITSMFCPFYKFSL